MSIVFSTSRKTLRQDWLAMPVSKHGQSSTLIAFKAIAHVSSFWIGTDIFIRAYGPMAANRATTWFRLMIVNCSHTWKTTMVFRVIQRACIAVVGKAARCASSTAALHVISPPTLASSSVAWIAQRKWHVLIAHVHIRRRNVFVLKQHSKSSQGPMLIFLLNRTMFPFLPRSSTSHCAPTLLRSPPHSPWFNSLSALPLSF